MGVPGMECETCHQDRNQPLSRVPGAPSWHVAPIEMAWVGKSAAHICNQLKDPARNGGKSLAQIVEHNAHDELVAWGWAPGSDREPAPGTQKQFGALIAAWVETGADCPTEESRMKITRQRQGTDLRRRSGDAAALGCSGTSSDSPGRSTAAARRCVAPARCTSTARPVRSCVTPVRRADGHAVTTIEGLAPGANHPLQQAWLELRVPAVWLLPGWTDHDRGRAPGGQAEADQRRHRCLAGRQPLPVRHVPADPRRHPQGGRPPGGRSDERARS